MHEDGPTTGEPEDDEPPFRLEDLKETPLYHRLMKDPLTEAVRRLGDRRTFGPLETLIEIRRLALAALIPALGWFDDLDCGAALEPEFRYVVAELLLDGQPFLWDEGIALGALGADVGDGRLDPDGWPFDAMTWIYDPPLVFERTDDGGRVRMHATVLDRREEPWGIHIVAIGSDHVALAFSLDPGSGPDTIGPSAGMVMRLAHFLGSTYLSTHRRRPDPVGLRQGARPPRVREVSVVRLRAPLPAAPSTPGTGMASGGRELSHSHWVRQYERRQWDDSTGAWRRVRVRAHERGKGKPPMPSVRVVDR